MKVLIGLQACHRLNQLKDAQRETWMYGCPVEHKFFMGRWEPPPTPYNVPGARMPGRADDMQTYRPSPPAQKPDEVWLDADDAKPALSEKVVDIIRWVYQEGYDFLFKCDIDTYLRPERLLASGFDKADYIGHPIRRQWRRGPVEYAQGGAGFWMSRRAMEVFLEADQTHIPFEDAEDVRMGWLLAEAGMKLQQDFRYEPYLSLARAPHTNNDIISTHKCNVEQMFIIDRRFQPGF